MPPLRLTPQQALRARASRAHLGRPSSSVPEVTRALAALHASDPATVVLSLWSRLPRGKINEAAEAAREALEERRSVVRLLAMRRTLHVVEVGLAPAALALARERLDGPQMKRLGQLLVQARVSTASGSEKAFESVANEVLDALGNDDLDTSELGKRVPVLQKKEPVGEGKPYAADVPLSRYVLEAMGNRGMLVRARAVGGWNSGRCTWARLDRWLPGLPPPPPPAEAYAALLRAWIGAFGPASLDDAAWWTGLPGQAIKKAHEALRGELTEVEVEGWEGPRWVLARAPLEGLDQPLPPAFLPALDPSIMAGKDRSAILAPAWQPRLFDRNGNAGPTVWLDGRVVGAWSCHGDKGVVFKLLERVSADQRASIEEEAKRLERALEERVILPRFPAPLSSELQKS